MRDCSIRKDNNYATGLAALDINLPRPRSLPSLNSVPALIHPGCTKQAIKFNVKQAYFLLHKLRLLENKNSVLDVHVVFDKDLAT